MNFEKFQSLSLAESILDSSDIGFVISGDKSLLKKKLHKSDACERGKCKNTSGKATHEYFPSMNMKLLRNIK